MCECYDIYECYDIRIYCENWMRQVLRLPLQNTQHTTKSINVSFKSYLTLPSLLINRFVNDILFFFSSSEVKAEFSQI